MRDGIRPGYPGPDTWRRTAAAWARALWPWVAVAGAVSWAVWPLLTAGDRVFAGKLATDNVVTAWFYDWVARATADGTGTRYVTPFNYPVPIERTVEFPSIADALLVAPLGWLLGWPRQWGASQAMAVAVNALGTALLARAAGARGIGVALAGALGAFCRPVWKDLGMARMNAAWPGIPLGALAAFLWTLSPVPEDWSAARTALRRAPAALAAALGGALAAMVYPPYVALLVPAGIALAAGPAVRARRVQWALAIAGIAGALALTAPHLLDMVAGQARAGVCVRVRCPDRWWAVHLENLFLLHPLPDQGISVPGVALGSWILAPLVLLHRRRLAGAVLLLAIAALCVLALGPCPTFRGSAFAEAPWVQSWLAPLWCRLEPIHDASRFATLGVTLAAVVAALGVESLANRPGPFARGGGALAAVAAIALAARQVSGDVLRPDKWQPVDIPDAARFLLGVEPGPVAELPFDRSGQFLSALADPRHPRLNPLRPHDPPPTANRFVVWLYSAGRGRVEDLPQAADAAESGLRWVILDEDRCVDPTGPRGGCPPGLRAALSSILGPPSRFDAGTWAWDVKKADTPE